MNYEEFKNYIKKENIDKNIFLLYGDEVHLKNHGRKMLLDRISPDAMTEFNMFTYEGKKYDLTSVKEAIEALPVFSDKKLLIFNNSGLFLVSGNDSATKEYKEFWEELIDEIPNDVYIVFDEAKIDKRNGLYKKLLKSDSVVEFAYLPEDQMINWTVGLFKTMGKVISPHEAKYLIDITQEGMSSVKREAEKIAAFTQGKTEVTRKDIDTVTVPVVENRVFDMVEAILSKNTEAALRMLNDLLILKEDETRILGAISSNVDKLLTVKLLSEEKTEKSVIASKTKIPPFVVSKYLSLSAKYSTAALKNLLTKCVESDRLFKLTRSDKAVVLQTFIAEFTTN